MCEGTLSWPDLLSDTSVAGSTLQRLARGQTGCALGPEEDSLSLVSPSSPAKYFSASGERRGGRRPSPSRAGPDADPSAPSRRRPDPADPGRRGQQPGPDPGHSRRDGPALRPVSARPCGRGRWGARAGEPRSGGCPGAVGPMGGWREVVWSLSPSSIKRTSRGHPGPSQCAPRGSRSGRLSNERQPGSGCAEEGAAGFSGSALFPWRYLEFKFGRMCPFLGWFPVCSKDSYRVASCSPLLCVCVHTHISAPFKLSSFSSSQKSGT